jgi:uncharacterized protein (TIGR02145 family)
MKSFRYILFLIVLLGFVVNSCQKPERDNPWDELANLDPEEWAPKGVSVARQDLVNSSLSWSFEDRNIQGFRIDRKTGDGVWQEAYVKLPKTARSWQDSLISPDTALTYQYHVYAYAGKNTSAPKALSFKPVFEAPSNLELEPLNDVSFEVIWQNNTQWSENTPLPQGFKVDRKIDEQQWQLAVAVLPTDQTSWVDTNVLVSRGELAVQYRVYAFYGTLTSSFLQASATTSLTPPSELTVTKNSISSVTLNWHNDNLGAQGFILERSYDTQGWEQLQKNNLSSYTDESFELNRMVYYRIAAYYDDYLSDYDLAEFNAEIPVPTNLQITQNSITSVTLNWQSNSTGEDGFHIERKQGTGDWEILTTSTATSYTDEAFELNSDISYRIVTYHGQYQSDFVEKSFDSQIPAPNDLSIAQNTISSITLNWGDNSIGEEGYRIERKQGTGDWEMLATLAGTSYTDDAFELNTVVSYRVTAYYGQYASDYVESSFNSQIPVPTGLQIIQNTITFVTLNWQDNSTREEGFRVERKQGTGDWELLATTTGTIYTDEAFELNTDVFYRIAAYYGQVASNYVENSFNSNIPTPEDFTSTSSSATSITLNWVYPDIGHEGFQLERKTNQEAWSVIEPNINPDILNYTDDQINLIQNDYSYRLQAYINSFFSDYSLSVIVYSQTVTNPITGKTWMDRNLGATGVAQSSTDAEAYGDLYQWGRLTDGHEKRTSGLSSNQSSSDVPGHGNFIVVQSSPQDWRSPQNNNLWQGVSGTNIPCPGGYRLPTDGEWESERQSWISNNAVGAFSSPLKLSMAGSRPGSSGSLSGVGTIGNYWSSTVDGTHSRFLNFGSNNAVIYTLSRANGLSVRCIKD